MKCSSIGIVWWFSLFLCKGNAQNGTTTYAKTKRNLSRDIHSYGESSLIFPLASNAKIYYEPKPSNYHQGRPLALVDLGQPVKVIEPKVAAEHVLYEFQQTPTDSVSNVHVKQLFQPDLKPPPPFPSNSPQTFVMAAETIAAPAQYTHFVQNHVQPINIKQHPLYNVQPTFVEPKKYVYGKIIVDSTHPQPNHFQQAPTAFHSNQIPIPPGQGVHITHGKPIISYVNYHPRSRAHDTQNLPPPITQANLPPITQAKFRPPPRNQHQPIDTPIYVERPHNEKSKSIASIEKPVVENEEVEEEPDEKSEHEEDEHDNYETPFDKYFDRDREDEDHHRDHDNFEEEDDEIEEDNKRGSSRYISKTEYYPKKYRKPKKYKPSSQYGHPEDKHFGNEKYKYKYKHARKSKYPRSELDTKFSEHIPVTHKKKILKEQWYLSKSLADDQ